MEAAYGKGSGERLASAEVRVRGREVAASRAVRASRLDGREFEFRGRGSRVRLKAFVDKARNTVREHILMIDMLMLTMECISIVDVVYIILLSFHLAITFSYIIG